MTKTESVILFSPSAGLIEGHYASYTSEIANLIKKKKINFKIICGPKFKILWEKYFPNFKDQVKLDVVELRHNFFFEGFLQCLGLLNNISKDPNSKIILLDFCPPPKIHLGLLLSLFFIRVRDITGIIHHFPSFNKKWNLRFYNFFVFIMLFFLSNKGVKLFCHNIESCHKYGNKLKMRYLNYGVSTNHSVLPKKEDDKFNKILFFGGIYKNKGIINFLKSAEILKNQDIYFSVYGKAFDISEEYIFNRIKNLKNINFYPGFFDDIQISSIFNSHDILVLPYDRNWKGTSGPLHLAIEFGLPVIVSDVYHFKHIVNEYSIGIVDPENTPLSLAKCIIRSVKNGQLSEENFEVARKENSFEALVEKLRIHG